MGSCMVGIVSTRLYMTCALTVPDCSDPGKYPEEYEWLAQGYFNRKAWTESIRKCEGKSLYNLGKANVLVL